jgi:hypothetical protein
MVRRLLVGLLAIGLLLIRGRAPTQPPVSNSRSTQSTESLWFRLKGRGSRTTVWLVLLTGGSAIFGLVLLAIYARQKKAVEVFAAGTLMALGVTAIASLVGFLFGLPRYSESDRPPGSRIADADAGDPVLYAGLYAPSNNLEQVSDWLTKLLIGAGLVQLGHVGRWLGGFIDELAGAFGSGDSQAVLTAKVLAASLLAYYSAFGFLFGYIITNTWYRNRLESLVGHIRDANKARFSDSDEGK